MSLLASQYSTSFWFLCCSKTSLHKVTGELNSYVDPIAEVEAEPAEGNFLAVSKQYLKRSLSEGPYRNIAFVYVISNSVVVLVGTIINQIFEKFGLPSVT